MLEISVLVNLDPLSFKLRPWFVEGVLRIVRSGPGGGFVFKICVSFASCGGRGWVHISCKNW